MSSINNQIPSLTKQMYLLALQFFRSSEFKNAQHELERVTAIFDIDYISELIRQGEWDKIEEYLLGFTYRDSNDQSSKIFFEISKQKYMEALDRGDKDGAHQILDNKLTVFDENYPDEVIEQLARLLWDRNWRKTPLMCRWKDLESSREALAAELDGMLRQNPDVSDKLEFPKPDDRIGELTYQCLNFQYKNCGHYSEDCRGDRVTLLQDHRCKTSGSVLPLPSSLIPVSQGLDLGFVGSSQFDNSVSSHFRGSSLKPQDALPEPEILAARPPNISGEENMDHVGPSSPSPPQVLISAVSLETETRRLVHLNCLPEEDEYMDVTEAADQSALPPILQVPFAPTPAPVTAPQTSTAASATPASLTTSARRGSSSKQKRIRSK